MRKHLIPCLLIGAAVLAFQQARSQPSGGAHRRAESMDKSASATYEHLATAIIAIEATENELVKSILLGYHAAAQNHLKAAIADETGRRGHLESAAGAIADIANEGDKRIQSIRQRLAKAGHTHNTDVETKDDYLFVNSKEKKSLLKLAGQVGKMEAGAKAADIQAAQEELTTLFDKAVAPE